MKMIYGGFIINQLWGGLFLNVIGSLIMSLLVSPWFMIAPTYYLAVIYDMKRLINKKGEEAN
jgi:hypothetical protein